jgi:DNA-directed RNA polymerase subunit omega
MTLCSEHRRFPAVQIEHQLDISSTSARTCLSKRDHIVPGTPAAPEGITNPPIDDLLKAADSKYALVIYSAKRARQINAYYSQLGEGLLEYVGPLVETHVHEKPLSIALREIDEGLLTSEPIEA